MKTFAAVSLIILTAVYPTAALDNGISVVSNDVSEDAAPRPAPPPPPVVQPAPPAAYDTWLIDGRLVQVPRGSFPAAPVYGGPVYGGQVYGGCPGGYCR